MYYILEAIYLFYECYFFPLFVPVSSLISGKPVNTVSFQSKNYGPIGDMKTCKFVWEPMCGSKRYVKDFKMLFQMHQ